MGKREKAVYNVLGFNITERRHATFVHNTDAFLNTNSWTARAVPSRTSYGSPVEKMLFRAVTFLYQCCMLLRDMQPATAMPASLLIQSPGKCFNLRPYAYTGITSD